MRAGNLEHVRWLDLRSNADHRGVLTSIEGHTDLPFALKRVFWVHDVIEDRGGHAHTDTDQVVVGLGGGLKVDISDGRTTRAHVLGDASQGLYVPRMLFIKLHNFATNGVCLVLASTNYDMSKSLRTWPEFLDAIAVETA